MEEEERRRGKQPFFGVGCVVVVVERRREEGGRRPPKGTLSVRDHVPPASKRDHKDHKDHRDHRDHCNPSSRVLFVFRPPKFLCQRVQDIPVIFQVLVFCFVALVHLPGLLCSAVNLSFCWLPSACCPRIPATIRLLGSFSFPAALLFASSVPLLHLLSFWDVSGHPTGTFLFLSSLLPCVRSSSPCVQMSSSLFWLSFRSMIVCHVSYKTFVITFHFDLLEFFVTTTLVNFDCTRWKVVLASIRRSLTSIFMSTTNSLLWTSSFFCEEDDEGGRLSLFCALIPHGSAIPLFCRCISCPQVQCRRHLLRQTVGLPPSSHHFISFSGSQTHSVIPSNIARISLMKQALGELILQHGKTKALLKAMLAFHFISQGSPHHSTRNCSDFVGAENHSIPDCTMHAMSISYFNASRMKVSCITKENSEIDSWLSWQHAQTQLVSSMIEFFLFVSECFHVRLAIANNRLGV